MTKKNPYFWPKHSCLVFFWQDLNPGGLSSPCPCGRIDFVWFWSLPIWHFGCFEAILTPKWPKTSFLTKKQLFWPFSDSTLILAPSVIFVHVGEWTLSSFGVSLYGTLGVLRPFWPLNDQKNSFLTQKTAVLVFFWQDLDPAPPSHLCPCGRIDFG